VYYKFFYQILIGSLNEDDISGFVNLSYILPVSFLSQKIFDLKKV